VPGRAACGSLAGTELIIRVLNMPVVERDGVATGHVAQLVVGQLVPRLAGDRVLSVDLGLVLLHRWLLPCCEYSSETNVLVPTVNVNTVVVFGGDSCGPRQSFASGDLALDIHPPLHPHVDAPTIRKGSGFTRHSLPQRRVLDHAGTCLDPGSRLVVRETRVRVPLSLRSSSKAGNGGTSEHDVPRWLTSDSERAHIGRGTELALPPEASIPRIIGLQAVPEVLSLRHRAGPLSPPLPH